MRTAQRLLLSKNPRLFKIKHGAGTLNFGITNGLDVRWYFPGGTASTASQPNVTVPAGTTKCFCSNWSSSSLQLTDGNTNANFTGALSDLPALTYYLSLYNCSLITGALSDLPALTYCLGLRNCPLVTGALSDLPALTYYLNLNGCSLVTGALSDLPPLTYFLDLSNCSLVTGALSDLPALAYFLGLSGCSLVTGVYSTVSGNNVPTYTYLDNTGLSSSDMDNTLIAYAATTKNNGTFRANGMTRTAASDAAVTTLTGIGRDWTVSGITKV